MKKVLLVILILSISLGSAFAELNEVAGYYTGKVGSNSKAQTVVSLNLGESGDSMVELYFLTSDSPVTSEGQTSNLAKDVDLEFGDGSTIATNKSKKLYAYWHIVSGDTLYVHLKIDAPLKIYADGGSASSDGSGIDWKASTKADEENGIKAASVGSDLQTQNTLVYKHDKLESKGSTEVNIETTTDDFSQLEKGKYQAYLSLICSTQS